MQDLKLAVSAILRDLCQGCNIYPENFEKTKYIRACCIFLHSSRLLQL